jgi:hypothetical protein
VQIPKEEWRALRCRRANRQDSLCLSPSVQSKSGSSARGDRTPARRRFPACSFGVGCRVDKGAGYFVFTWRRSAIAVKRATVAAAVYLTESLASDMAGSILPMQAGSPRRAIASSAAVRTNSLLSFTASAASPSVVLGSGSSASARAAAVIGGEIPDAVLGRLQPASSEFLSGDQNLLNVRVVAQYSVSEPKNFLFQTEDVDRLVKVTVESELARPFHVPVD